LLGIVTVSAQALKLAPVVHVRQEENFIFTLPVAGLRCAISGAGTRRVPSNDAEGEVPVRT